MPDEDRQFLFPIPRLNRWFAVSSAALLFAVGWLVWDDYSREWKHYQRRFRVLEYEKTEERIREAEAAIPGSRRAELEAALAQARAEEEQREREIRDLERRTGALEARKYRVTQDYQFTKAELSQAEYYLNEALKHQDPSLPRHQARVERLRAQLAAYDDQVKEVQEEGAALASRRAEITGAADRVRGDLDRLYAERDRLRKKLRTIDYNLANAVRNLPILDFMNPSLRIQQFVLPDVLLDLNFLETSRVDRCTTCHLAIDREDYSGEEPPFAPHPHLDLMVGGSSPHPKEAFGCTGCHQGLDRATSFVLAAHTPEGPHEAAEWERRHEWEPLHHWEYPMWSRPHFEAACYKCHDRQVEIGRAEALNRGKALFEDLGCHGCHKVEGFETLPRVGPDLRRIASKTTRDWIYRWIADPKAFRPTTKMPRFFFTANRSGPGEEAYNHAEIAAITAFLWARSERPAYPPPPPGNPARGRALVRQVGCQGCHLEVDEPPAQAGEEAGRFAFGPSLRRIGEKADPGWLFAWLRDPRAYHPETRMPDLRLTRQEAADLTAYLRTLRSPEAGTGPGPDAIDAGERDRARDDLVRVFLRRELTRDQTEARIGALAPEEKDLFLGEGLISRYGCAGCHAIAGFENAQRIGVELTEEGHKNVRKLDFGAVEIEATVPAWLYQKMKDSRIFDLKREVAWENKLRMPDFALTDAESEAIVTVLLGFQKKSMRPRNAKVLSAAEEAIEAGRRLVRHHNCRGCHILEGKGGDIRAPLARELARAGIAAEEVAAFAPPNLFREGSKVQPDWLFRFLLAPQPIRPWLDVRMPTFHFTDAEATTLARYFALADAVDFPFSSQTPESLTAAEISAARTLFSRDYLNCTSCHQQGARKPEGPPSGWAPDFELARRRLRPAWIGEWLRDPQALLPGTKMPSYFGTAESGPPDVLGGDEARQIEVLRKYLLTLGS